MGLIKTALDTLGTASRGVLADQWLEFFYCESLPPSVLVARGKKRINGRSSNNNGGNNIISNGSVIAVADGQFMIIVEQGKIIDFCAETGQYTLDIGNEPSLFAEGSLNENALDALANVYERFKFGGSPGKDMRVYYFNTKELIGNKYGTPNPIPFRVVDKNIGLDIDISLRCFGEYSYRIVNPMLFYSNVCGNVLEDYTRDKIDNQLKGELMTALQPAFSKISAMGIRYSMLPAHTMELTEALNEVLSEKWRNLRGLEIVSLGVTSVKASDDDEKMIKELQRNATFRNPAMAAAHLLDAQATAIQKAAANENAGSAMAFMGMNMAVNAGGMDAQNLFTMGEHSQTRAPCEPRQSSSNSQETQIGVWTCICGYVGNTGNFCMECGKPRFDQAAEWTCLCGMINKGKFCSECGKPKSDRIQTYECGKCGWKPADKNYLSKFCPECGASIGNENFPK